MIENKRFTHKKWHDERQLFDYDKPFAIVDVNRQAENICNKLNGLHKENQQLKEQILRLEHIACAGICYNDILRKRSGEK